VCEVFLPNSVSRAENSALRICEINFPLFFSAFYEKVALIRFSISSVCDVFLQLWHFETGWFKGRVASRYRLQIIVALMAAVETEVQGNPGFEGGGEVSSCVSWSHSQVLCTTHRIRLSAAAEQASRKT
jgi:hypothetical protein